jgi:hypothetical protein
MSAIVGTAVETVDLVKNTAEELTFTAATNTGATTADTETFYITPSKPDGEALIVINNACGQTVNFQLLAGDFWYNATDQTAFGVADGKTYIMSIDTAKFLQNTGKLHLKAIPTTTTALTASNDVKVSYVELRT